LRVALPPHTHICRYLLWSHKCTGKGK